MSGVTGRNPFLTPYTASDVLPTPDLSGMASTLRFIANATIAVGDIVYVSGVYDTTNYMPKVELADADAIGTATGPMFVAMTAATAGNTVIVAPWYVFSGIDTSTGADGSGFVYLSGTAGGKTYAPTAFPVPIGIVLRTHASTGVALVCPGWMTNFGSAIPRKIADPGNAGAIPTRTSGTVALVTAAAETRTLAAPKFLGQEIMLFLDTDGGDCVVTVSAAFNASNNTVLTFDDAKDYALLKAGSAGGTLRWQEISKTATGS